MKAIIGYLFVVAVLLIVVVHAVKSPDSSVSKTKSAIEANIEARKAALDAY